MKHLLLILFSIPLCSVFFGQERLANSRKTSVHTYIYKITAREASELQASKQKDWEKKLLYKLVDSFATDSINTPVLPRGNYLFVRADKSRLQYSLQNVDDVQVKAFTNGKDLLISLHETKGEAIAGASVFLDGKACKYDPSQNAYIVRNFKRAGLLKINHKEVFQQFQFNGYRTNRVAWWKRLTRKYIVMPFRRWVQKKWNNEYSPNYFSYKTTYEEKYTGFMVFNQPKFKPNDTVKVKAYILNKSKRPINRPVLVRLTSEGFDTDTIIATLRPYAKGGYEFSFVLNDSLDLLLDEEYMLSFEELKSRKYDLDAYEGDLEEDEYANKRKILMRGKFYFEEYELNSLNFKARLDKQEYHRGEQPQLILKATDENNLPVLDGRVQIVITTANPDGIEYTLDQQFIPDTLFQKVIDLDATGETKYTLSDSIFPAANMLFAATCNLKNSNNEMRSSNLSGKFIANPYAIDFKRKADSVSIKAFFGGKSISMPAKVQAYTNSDHLINTQLIQLPGQIQISPFVEYYQVITDSVRGIYRTNNQESGLLFNTLRTKDSVFVRSINPAGVNFWYSIFREKKLLKTGYGTSVDWRSVNKKQKGFSLVIHYIYGNRIQRKTQLIQYAPALLAIETDLPQKIRPGQSLDVQLTVKDSEGEPVKDADVTAYAFTSKFENSEQPFVPYLGKNKRVKRPTKFFNQSANRLENSGYTFLNWKKWSRAMSLDSLLYFRFLFTPGIFLRVEAAKDSVTQVAPFILSNNAIDPVQQLYIDEIPVYWRRAEQEHRYSFNVSPGYHSFSIRTYDKLIKIDSVWATKGVKTFIGINSDTTINKDISVQKMPDTLTSYEKIRWSNYMILVSNQYNESYSFISQNSTIKLINAPWKRNTGNSSLLIGPLNYNYTFFEMKDGFSIPFTPEGNSLYEFSEKLIRQRMFPQGQYMIGRSVSTYAESEKDLGDEVLTIKEMDSLWRAYLNEKSRTIDFITGPHLDKYANGKLVVGLPSKKNELNKSIKAIFLFRYDNPDFLRVFKGVSGNLGYQEPGEYRMLIMLQNGWYSELNNLLVKSNGINYYRLPDSPTLKRDTLVVRLNKIGDKEKWKPKSTYSSTADSIRDIYNQRFFDSDYLVRLISGKIKDMKSGEPVVGASVHLKGTSFGTVTNSDGTFEMRVPVKGTLIISAVGYEQRTRNLTDEFQYDVELTMSSNALQEVVVTGFGVRSKKEITGSIARIEGSLEGRVAGLSIRGVSSLGGKPLIVVNGIPFDGNLEDLDPDLLQNIEILKSAEAVSIYGSRAADGVIIIGKKSNLQKLPEPVTADNGGNRIRKNFRDYAYWKPSLRTDKDGRVKFHVDFPDDLTNWSNQFIVIGNRKSGQLQTELKAINPMAASLSMPAFLVEGDSAVVIGKLLNYTNDTTIYKRTFKVKGKDSLVKWVNLENKHIDSFGVVAAGKDSIHFQYSAVSNNGYLDGEERSVPIFKKGVKESKGIFIPILSDTNFSWVPDKEKGPVTLYTNNSALPILLDEIESIHRYEYLCNEQMASKLKAILLKKRIHTILGKPFSNEKTITFLIESLLKSRTGAKLWGWWQGNNYQLWISMHVIEALLMAKQDGYQLNLDEASISSFLLFNLESYRPVDALKSLQILQKLGAKINYGKYIDSIRRDTTLNQYDRLSLIWLDVQIGRKANIDSLLQRAKRSTFGNFYFGHENLELFDNVYQNSLLVYKILRKTGGYDTQMRSIRNFFLEKRQSGTWRNTYESALILETIIPDLLMSPENMTSTLTVNGIQVNQFPYETKLASDAIINISSKGKWPIYFTAYQTFQNQQPEAIEGLFILKSSFLKDNQPISQLVAGEPVLLQVSLHVTKPAEFVMMEIPIPAGCSYKSKEQGYGNNEVHREYFKNKVSVFCSSLVPGNYTFQVNLLPRYTGNYILNPAKAEMMYFPLFFGRTGIKQTTIK